MTKAIQVHSIIVLSEDKKGNPVFEAVGTLNESPFAARTVQYKGEPIFKLQEKNGEGALNNTEKALRPRLRVSWRLVRLLFSPPLNRS